MGKISAPWLKLKAGIDREDYTLINRLQEQCVREDRITLKLELDYKLEASQETGDGAGLQHINEFMYFDEQQLVGYLGISHFGGTRSPLEVTGMVHPAYRRQGIFTRLYEMAVAEWKRRNSGGMLLLCDRASVSGQKYIAKIDAVYRHSEYEMYLRQNHQKPQNELLSGGLSFRKATNADGREIARQNAIYFDDETYDAEDASKDADSEITSEHESVDNDNDGLSLPETEEQRGMRIYLAELNGQSIGKFHLQMTAEAGGIFGLGVLPEHRGQGFGRAILQQAIEKLQEADMKEIFLQVAAENAKALQLYKSCGFQETSTMDYYEASCNRV
ncbi:GNAT family N-acetyltransferase [Paenibacillus sp. Marseille-P2973]|uniref:GNAT family N-acetyltransferase n=1 Tax=Paenibacillus sp. Marseille-P2973 TaxID=1871032 RepID=UPI001B368E6F|nr:GNAT family N-acetyltransferase [Paenibacillus sp. Marseille-P2973]MBQ4900256.1 GNAT family N-acetyltransferase [Paenibacillus sp. Marseille-P2973]